MRHLVFIAIFSLVLSACVPMQVEQRKRFFWPPPPGEPKIEYINFYFTDADMLRGVDRRLEEFFFGLSYPERIIVQPYSVASDGDGKVYVGDFSDSKLILLDFVKKSHQTLMTLDASPRKMTIDSNGFLWVLTVGEAKNLIRFDAAGKIYSSLSLDKLAERPVSFAVDLFRRRLYIADTPSHQIKVLDLEGNLITTFGKKGSDNGEFNYPTDLALDKDGNLFVVDSLNCRVQMINPEGGFVRAFGERGTSVGSFAIPKAVAVSPSGLVMVSDARLNKIVIFDHNGNYLITVGGPFVFQSTNSKVVPGGLYFPSAISIDKNETIWIADLLNGMIHEYQYLTPEFLAKRPIDSKDVYVPTQVDKLSGLESEKNDLIPSKQ